MATFNKYYVDKTDPKSQCVVTNAKTAGVIELRKSVSVFQEKHWKKISDIVARALKL